VVSKKAVIKWCGRGGFAAAMEGKWEKSAGDDIAQSCKPWLIEPSGGRGNGEGVGQSRSSAAAAVHRALNRRRVNEWLA
jgi:hypothetical protein